jgi:holo-[acyl-carrier protein] synthase
MIYGIGTDVVSYERIKSLHERYGERVAQRMLSEAELAEYVRSADPARYLMKHFAAKEAFAKAMGTGLRASVTLRRISIGHDDLGKPLLSFDEVLSNYVARMGVTRNHLSISDEREHAVAFVVLERD